MERTTWTSILGIAVPVALGIALAAALGDGGIERGGMAVVAWCIGAAFAVNWVAYVPAAIARTEHFYDLIGSTTYVVATLVALGLGNREPVSVVLAGLILVWAGRLGSFLFARVRRAGSDGRFDAIKTSPLRFLMAWTMQGLWVSATAMAAWAAMTADRTGDLGGWTLAGGVLWALGFGIEVRADAEKRAFRANDANRGRFITTGLWAWSRHPNYFGEILLWVGIAVIAVPMLAGWQWVALGSPVFVTVLLTQISDLPPLERRADKRWGDDPEYQRYVADTPVLIPRPPRR